jgi:hypothetical protein
LSTEGPSTRRRLAVDIGFHPSARSARKPQGGPRRQVGPGEINLEINELLPCAPMYMVCSIAQVLFLFSSGYSVVGGAEQLWTTTTNLVVGAGAEGLRSAGV